ncbi:MAG: class I adenylate-forming enzyme family protein, partial [Betaproteobacteria bacterium]
MDDSRNLAFLLQRTARNWPRLPAVALGDVVLHDYAALARRASGLGAAMRDAGILPGERVAIVARNVPATIETLFACWWVGLTAVPVNAKLHPLELSFVLANSGARWVFVDEAWARVLAENTHEAPALERVQLLGDAAYEQLVAHRAIAQPDAVAPSDPAWLFYTSGTTGRPKGVVISHSNLHAMSQCFVSDVEAIAPGDAILHPAPLSHGSGLYVIPHVARGAVNVVPASGGFDPAEIVTLLERWDHALFFAA